MKETIIDIGDTVLCDSCNADYTTREDTGGMVFLSNAYCPACYPRMIESVEKYGEQKYIRALCPLGMSFGDFVRAYRGGDNKIMIQTFDNPADAIAAMSDKHERDDK